MAITVRQAKETDWPSIWEILEPVFRAGETYAFPVDIDKNTAYQTWMEAPLLTFIAESEGQGILGTYYIKPNQLGPGSHICNCGYVVSENAQGKGVASEMCLHSQRFAIDQGFRAMQFNLVVSSNEGAVRLWQKLGFDIKGTLPGAFSHPSLGYVDAYIMFKTLT